MKELKIRAYWKSFKEMRYFENGYIQCGYKDYETGILLPIDKTKKSVYMGSCETMEFIGLKDKNGVAIYEGDIVKGNLFHKGGVLPTMGIITWYGEFAAYCIENEGGKTLLHNHDISSFVVVGNVHENAELLKVS